MTATTVPLGAAGKRRKRGRATPWIMLAPALFVIGVFLIYPAINAVWLSLTSTNLLNPSAQKFIGLDNFVNILDDPVFYRALTNSLIWIVGCVGLQLVVGTIGALLMNRPFRGRGVVRAVVLIPWATSSILVSLMWGWMLNPNLGIINGLLQRFGLQDEAVAWLGNPATAMPTLIFIDVWQGVPFFALMVLAALQGVPDALFEAAAIDGAGAWRTFWKVTVPLILPAVMITTVLRLIWTANYVDLILVLTNGGPANATLTIPVHAYQTGYGAFNFGEAAALGVAQAILLAALAFVYIRQLRKNEDMR